MKELWVPAEQDVIVRLHSNGDVGVTQDVLMVKRPVGGQRKTGFSSLQTDFIRRNVGDGLLPPGA